MDEYKPFIVLGIIILVLLGGGGQCQCSIHVDSKPTETIAPIGTRVPGDPGPEDDPVKPTNKHGRM